MFNFILLFALISKQYILPKPGNVYSKTITIPVIGEQYIETKITSKNKADIILKGMINQNGSAVYYNFENNEFVKISYNLRKTLNNMKVDFEIPDYDQVNDLLVFSLKIKPIYYKKKFTLDRKL